ncbi:hypothetical protein OP486_20450 [Clostridium kluyveri]|uniref:Uncharacterized protein n=1 Tax=Clostridium kluyveri TaxID=1534 RepID=A0A1L5F998_CLOKL|nr:hypothetical protein [Clostridium kluyveri]APM39562.1 hypothetical protein BS101_12825 [Clostridium kluyveri]UZQ50275.1 hypothetical protein OP486_20450 [Clostridium kluyveri]
MLKKFVVIITWNYRRGLYLFEINSQTIRAIEYLKKNNVKELYSCHCISFCVKAEIHKFLPIKEVGVGLEINW